MKIDLDILADIESGAWLQAEDDPRPTFRSKFFKLLDNEFIKRGFAECKTENCQADHKETIQEKYLLTPTSNP